MKKILLVAALMSAPLALALRAPSHVAKILRSYPNDVFVSIDERTAEIIAGLAEMSADELLECQDSIDYLCTIIAQQEVVAPREDVARALDDIIACVEAKKMDHISRGLRKYKKLLESGAVDWQLSHDRTEAIKRRK